MAYSHSLVFKEGVLKGPHLNFSNKTKIMAQFFFFLAEKELLHCEGKFFLGRSVFTPGMLKLLRFCENVHFRASSVGCLSCSVLATHTLKTGILSCMF